MRALALSGGKDSMAVLHLCRDRLDCAIYVNTGFSYPETRAMIAYAETLLTVHTVHSDRAGQNEREGLPADVVPVDWTRFGQQISGAKSVTVQNYLSCCYENVMAPAWAKAKALGVTHLYLGQRREEARKSPVRDGTLHEGITRVHPIEDWTEAQVFAYLSEKMEIPAHYAIKHSSLDCFDCTAYRKDSTDRVEWMRSAHPSLYAGYAVRAAALNQVLAEAI